MLRNLSVGGKTALLVLSIVCFAVVILGTVFNRFVKEVIRKRTLFSIATVTDLKKQQVDLFFNQAESNSKIIKGIFANQPNLAQLSDIERKAINTELNLINSESSLTNTIILDQNKQIVFSESNSKTSINRALIHELKEALPQSDNAISYGNILVYGSSYLFPIVQKIQTDSGKPLYLITAVKLNKLYGLLADTVGLGSTGEVLIGSLSNNKNGIVHNPLRFNPDASFKLKVTANGALKNSFWEAIQQRNGTGQDIDYRGKEVLASWRYLPKQNWGLVIKIDEEEIFSPLTFLRLAFTGTGIFVVLVTLVLAWVASRILVEPLINLKNITLLMAQGVLPDKLPSSTTDEIGKISEALNALVDSMHRTAQFANEIGSGNTKADYQLLSDYDVLGKSLLQMRNNLNESNLKEEYRNKLLKGEAEASEIARALQQNVELLSNSLISFICQQIDGVHGAVYILGNDIFQSNILFLKGSYALNTDSEIKKTFKVGEGLVGQSVKDGLTYYRTGVQMNMPSVNIGLFNPDTKSGCLLIVPLIFNAEKVGVIEIAALHELDNQKQQLAFALCKVLAASVYNTRINERTNNLLNEQKELTSELQEKQRELGQQTEEMKLAQASLKEAYVQLTKQFNEVKLTEKRIQVLMENATEIIAIYNEDGTIRYVSPSVEPILGYKPEELMRKDDNELVVNGLDAVLQRRKELLANPATPITIQFTYKNKFGEEVFIESRGLNMLHDPAINGIIVNARDVTSTVMAERESKIRSEMQALSENSTDIIARINNFGVFFYINPTIKQYTGLEPKQFLNRRITDFPLSQIELLNDWTRVIGEILSTRRKVKREVEFNSSFGNRTLMITAVPELNIETNSIDSILIVCHDITERKLIELEIQNKSNKITESITYAKRIQLAILPEENSIRQMFPNSFVIFKPKDVVSGDFVWSLKKDNDLYVAVVDCTGHGVPGALLSLIGYFLLQDITRTESEPALILNRLDKGLTDSLRFNNAETGTRDGMDIAICRINMDTQTLTFAGAHRPLYLQRNSEVLEFKGDKFPVGSMEFFNATTFTQQEIPISSSDRILLFSDGFADQFGGPDDKKYTAKRIRDVFAQNQANSISKLADLYNTEIELWKGSNRQIDDILMVGIEI